MDTLAADKGGTLSDAVVIDGKYGRAYSGKSLSTPEDLQRGVMSGFDRAEAEAVDVIRNSAVDA